MKINNNVTLEGALSNDCLFTSLLFKRPESMSIFFPYEGYLKDGSIYINKDGSLGAIFEINLLEHETMTGDEIATKIDSLKSWLNLPKNCVLQVIFDQRYLSSRDQMLNGLLGAYPRARNVSDFLFKARVSDIKSRCQLAGEGSPMIRRGWIAIRYFLKTTSRPLVYESFMRGEATLSRETREFVRELNLFEHLIRTFEENSKVGIKRIEVDGFLQMLRHTCNPKTFYQRSFLPFNPSVELSDQILYNNPSLDYPGPCFEGIMARTMSLKTSPQWSYPGGMANLLKVPFPFRVTISFSFPSQTKVKQFFDLKEFFLQNTPSARAKRQREEVLVVQDQLARDDRCLHMTFNVTVTGDSEEQLDNRISHMANIFNNDLECEVITERDIGCGLWFAGLPLNYHPKTDNSARRFVRILRSDATRFLPVFDSWRGLGKPVQAYLSRENNLVRFSLTENKTSNHTVVLADSGSGKSSFIIDAIQAVKRKVPEPLVFVIDKKSSYSMVAEYFDADLTVFDRRGEMPFSPFRGVFDEDKVAFLTGLISTAVKMLSPSFEMESDHLALITKSLRMAHDRKVKEQGLSYRDGRLIKNDAKASEPTFGMDDVVTELAQLTSLEAFEKFGPSVETLMQKLTPFFGDGMYARYFNSNEVGKSPKSRLFYIYDLDALDGDPVLQTLMTMAVIEEIRQTIKLPENEGREGYVVIEELQMLSGNNDTGRRFVEDAAQTFRKLGVWLISLTPRPQNYFETAAGRAMWGVADNFVFMQMSPDNVDYLKTHSTMLDEASTEIVKSLKTIPGDRAEVYYTNKKKTACGAFSFFQTPFDRWLAPTNARSAREAKSALRQFPDDKWKALKHLAKKYPNGLE